MKLDYLFSKISLYDILVMVIPGGVLLYALFPEISSTFPEIGSDTIKWTFIAVLAYLIGLINHQLTSLVWRPFRNSPKMLSISLICFRARFLSKKSNCLKKLFKSCKIKTQNGIVHAYYKAYYHVTKKGYNNDITIMEGQVAFLQSMLLPVIAMSASLACCGKMQPCCKWVSIVLILSMIVTIYKRQMKIYNRVWEDDKYL